MRPDFVLYALQKALFDGNPSTQCFDSSMRQWGTININSLHQAIGSAGKEISVVNRDDSYHNSLSK